MKKQHRSILFMFILVLIAAFVLAGCEEEIARRPFPEEDRRLMPNNPAAPVDPGVPNNPATPNNPFTQENRNLPGQNAAEPPMNAGQGWISSTFEMVDYTYATITTSSLNVRSGPSTGTPIIGKVYSGQKIRVAGKLDDWLVIRMPNSNKLGCILARHAKPYSSIQGNPVATPTPAPAAVRQTAPVNAAMGAQESRILELLNAERAKTGAKPLRISGEVSNLARVKSQDMVDNNYFSHQSPTHGSPFDMLKRNGVSYMYAGENIAMNQTAERAHNAWMNSEGHRKNILNPNFTEIGIGIVPKGNGSFMYTQIFIGR